MFVMDRNLDPFTERLMEHITQDPFFNRVLVAMVDNVLDRWTRNKTVRRLVANRVRKSLYDGLVKNCSVYSLSGQDLINDPQTTSELARIMPRTINLLFSMLSRLSDNTASKSPEVQAAQRNAMYDGLDVRAIGEFITKQAKGINNLTNAEPNLQNSMEKIITDLIESIDFGELAEAMEKSEDAIHDVFKVFNAVIRKYPAKFICLLGFIPPVIKGIIKAATETVKPLNGLPPDLLADVVLSLVRKFDGKEIGTLVNEINNVIRGIHIGSVLIGEKNLNKIAVDLQVMMRDVMTTIDPTLAMKVKIMLAKEANNYSTVMTGILAENFEVFASSIKSYSGVKNPRIESYASQLSLFEGFPEADVASAVSDGLSELDTQGIGDNINTLIRIFNMLHKQDPRLAIKIVAGTVSVIDTDELGSACSNIVNDVLPELRPVVQAVLPSALNGLCDLLTPGPGEDAAALNASLAKLRQTLCQKGGEQHAI